MSYRPYGQPPVDVTALVRGQILQPDGWVYGHRIHVNIHDRLAFFHHVLVLADAQRLAKTWERLVTRYVHKHPAEPTEPYCYNSRGCGDTDCCAEESCDCCASWREYVVKLRAWLSR